MSKSDDEMPKKTDENLRHRAGTNSDNDKSKSQINAEYFQALEQWLNDVRSYRYSCNILAGLPYAMMAQQMNGFPIQNINNFVPPIPPFNQPFGMFTFQNLRHPNQQAQQQRQDHQQQPQQQQDVAEEGNLWRSNF